MHGDHCADSEARHNCAMSPDRIASIVRDLYQSPKQELAHFARRHGLTGEPSTTDVERAQEIVRALALAFQSGPGPNWRRVHDAYETMVSRHGVVDMSAIGPAPPQWVR